MKQKNLSPVVYSAESITSESISRVLKLCYEILELCSDRDITISDMQSLPDLLSTEIGRAIRGQLSKTIFVNPDKRKEVIKWQPA